MEIVALVVCLVLAYLIGSIPTSLLIGKIFFQKDIRQYGSGNLGGTNAGRVLGKKTGVVVITIDVLKSVLVIVVSRWILLMFGIYETTIWFTISLMVASIGSVIGHCYPIFAGFRGGKAVASFAGFILSTNWILSLAFVMVFFGMLKWKKMVSLASITMSITLAIISLLPWVSMGMLFGIGQGWWYSLTLFLLSFFLIYRHRENIERIRRKTERKITWMK